MNFVEKTKSINYIKQFDYMLFAAVLLLSSIGILVLKSAIGEEGIPKTLLKQIICLTLGIIMAILISLLDYKDFKVLGLVLYVASIMLLCMVYVPGIGKEVNGSRSWLILPVIGQFQPSEIAKVAFAVTVPVFFERLKDGKDIVKNTIKLLLYAGIPIGLVVLQRDVGTAMVFTFSFVIMLFIYGIPYKYFLISIGACLAAAPVLWFFVIPKYFLHIRSRIISFLYPESDLLGAGMQVYRSKMTIGSGQLFGKGLFHGIQTQNSGTVSSAYYVPYKQTDFIFSVIGEELGFIGSLIVLALIFFILFRGIYIATQSRDAYGTFVVICIISMLAFHFFENIGMCIGVLPVTGIPLPFISQGGSSLIANYINVGVLLSVSMRRKRAIFNSQQ
jgi:rod shape determining protein RodA